MLLKFKGPSALSEFRRAPLLERCQEELPQLADITATHLYMVQLRRAPDEGRSEEHHV